MNKREMRLLERAYEREVESALTPLPHIMQTKSKLASKLVDEGFLDRRKLVFRGVTLDGFELTQLGRMTYCTSADFITCG